jgi:phage tail sheath protein FI
MTESPIRPDPEIEILRTHPGDPSSELNYVNLRRYFAYLEHSLDEGTQWVVFEPNDDALWARVRSTVTDFLTTEWRSGKLQGATAEQAFFVRCDQTTMTQNDLDNGRLIMVIGVAPVKPAEFVIFNIGQWTAGHRP